MAEMTFLDEGGVTVTNARFVVPAQTYAMSGITSVKSLKHTPSIKGPVILGLIGLAGLGGKDTTIVALIFLAAGIAWFILNKPKYSAVLRSASGEAEALTSKDSDFISRIVKALNEAIISRG